VTVRVNKLKQNNHKALYRKSNTQRGSHCQGQIFYRLVHKFYLPQIQACGKMKI
jgi:hypothetical protein